MIATASACPDLDHLNCTGCACPCHSSVVPIRPDLDGREVKRVGLGYVGSYPADGVEITFERIRESRGEIHGELFVRLRGDALNFAERHLFGGNFNASSLTARSTVSKYLKARVSLDWPAIMERFCLAVLRDARRGSDLKMVGQRPARERPTYLLDPILPLGKPTILFGPGGTGKSTLAAGVVVSIETGQVVVPGWNPTPGRVLILDWEDGEDEWNDRLQAIAAGRGLPFPNVAYREMSRPLADDVEGVARHVTEHGVLLLIVDSVGLAIGSSREGEGWNDGVFRLFAALRELGTTALLVDHPSGADVKSDDSVAKPYGGVYKVNLARSVFELRRERDGSADRAELLLVHKKTNPSAKLQPQGLTIAYEDHRIRFDRTTVEAPDLVRALSVPTRMERLLDRSPMTTKDLAGELNTTDSTIRAILSRDKGARFTRLPDGRVGRAMS